VARSVGITRAQVVETAAALADEGGLDQLTLAQVAGRLGVKLPSLYNHVDGLPALRRELALLGTRLLGAALARAAVGRSGDEAVRAVTSAYRAFVLERPGLYAATVRAPAPDDREHQALAAEVLDVIVAILTPYALDADGTIHAARALRAIAHGFATIEGAGGFGLAQERDASFAHLVEAYLAGLRLRASLAR
jgi:AcrR family transcriptional regulator